MNIRRAKVNDASDIAELSAQLGYPIESGYVECFLEQIEQDEGHCVFLAELDMGTVVGWIHIYKAERLTGLPFAEIGGLVIEKGSRGQGLGSELLSEAEKWARSKNCQKMLIRSNVIREQAHRFYQSAGYQLVKSQNVFTKKLARD
jgi:GNAT superfamily N-acetyltransferase